MKILGIDVGNGLAVCTVLDQFPDDRFYHLNRDNFDYFASDNKIDDFNLNGFREYVFNHQPDIACIEPTGGHYSELWIYHLKELGVKVNLVGHSALAFHREFLELPDKEDESDAYALANYGLMYHSRPEKFLRERTPEIKRLRRLALRIKHLDRIKHPLEAGLRQYLAWQFPEVSNKEFRISGKNPPLLLRWLSGQAEGKWGENYQNAYDESLGLGLECDIYDDSRRLTDIYRELIEIDREIDELLNLPEFQPYIKAMNRLRLGKRDKAILISQFHPLTDFLDENLKPFSIVRQGRKYKNGKPNMTRRHISLRQFKKMLGLAPSERSSGKHSQKKTKGKTKIIGGSQLCRSTLFLWHRRIVEVAATRNNCEMAKKLWLWENDNKRKNKPYNLLRMNGCAKAVEWLFYDMVNELREFYMSND